MMNGITFHTTRIIYEPPDHVKQVVHMVRSLSTKYVPMPLLNEVEIDLLHGLKDFHHRAHKRATTVKLCEGTVESPARCSLGPTQAQRPSDASFDINSWHKAKQPKEIDPDWYVLGSNLYDTILAYPEVDSGKKQLENFLDKLEMEFVNSIKALCKKDTRSIPDRDRVLAKHLHELAEDPDWSLVQSDKTSHWLPIHLNN